MESQKVTPESSDPPPKSESKLRRLFQIIFNIFVLCSIIGLVSYIAVDATKETDSPPVTEPPLIEADEIIATVRVCSNANEKHNAADQDFEWTELDKYVWAKDESYRFEISKFNCSFHMRFLFYALTTLHKFMYNVVYFKK